VTRSVVILVVALGLASLGLWLGRGLNLDTGVEALLPADSVSVLSIKETRDKLGLEEPLTILVASDDPDRNKALTAQLAEIFAQWPETVWVMTSYGLDALAERALYYVDADTLYEWNELAEEALDWEVCKASPLCVTIADPPELPDSDAVREAVDLSPAGVVLRQLTGESAKQAGAGGEGSEDGPQALCNDEGTVCGVQVMLSGSPGDLGYARMIKERAEEFFKAYEESLIERTMSPVRVQRSHHRPCLTICSSTVFRRRRPYSRAYIDYRLRTHWSIVMAVIVAGHTGTLYSLSVRFRQLQSERRNFSAS